MLKIWWQLPAEGAAEEGQDIEIPREPTMPLRDQCCIRSSRETQSRLNTERNLVEFLAVSLHVRRWLLHLRVRRFGGYGNKHGQRLGGEVLEEGELGREFGWREMSKWSENAPEVWI